MEKYHFDPNWVQSLNQANFSKIRRREIIKYKHICRYFLQMENPKNLKELAMLIIKRNNEDRIEDEIMVLKLWTEKFNFFKELNAKSRNVQMHLHKKCCVKMEYESVKKGETVFLAGVPADKFYIILKGSVNVLIPKKPEILNQEILDYYKQKQEMGQQPIEYKRLYDLGYRVDMFKSVFKKYIQARKKLLQFQVQKQGLIRDALIELTNQKQDEIVTEYKDEQSRQISNQSPKKSQNISHQNSQQKSRGFQNQSSQKINQIDSQKEISQNNNKYMLGVRQPSIANLANIESQNTFSSAINSQESIHNINNPKDSQMIMNYDSDQNINGSHTKIQRSDHKQLTQQYSSKFKFQRGLNRQQTDQVAPIIKIDDIFSDNDEIKENIQTEKSIQLNGQSSNQKSQQNKEKKKNKNFLANPMDDSENSEAAMYQSMQKVQQRSGNNVKRQTHIIDPTKKVSFRTLKIIKRYSQFEYEKISLLLEQEGEQKPKNQENQKENESQSQSISEKSKEVNQDIQQKQPNSKKSLLVRSMGLQLLKAGLKGKEYFEEDKISGNQTPNTNRVNINQNQQNQQQKKINQEMGVEVQIDSDDGDADKIVRMNILHQQLCNQLDNFDQKTSDEKLKQNIAKQKEQLKRQFTSSPKSNSGYNSSQRSPRNQDNHDLDVNFDDLDYNQLLEQVKKYENIIEQQNVFKEKDPIKEGLGGIKLTELDDIDSYVQEGVLTHKYVVTLKEGLMFGELGILYQQPRLATIIAAQDTEFAVLSGKDYKKILQQAELKKQNDKLDFFQENILQNGKRKNILEFIQNFEKVTYLKGSLIYSEGQVPQHINIIKKGVVEQYKRVEEVTQSDQDYNSINNRKQLMQAFSENNKSFKKNPRKVLNVPISILTKGQYFGDVEILDQTKRLTSMICVSEKVVVYQLKQNLFQNYLRTHSSFLPEFQKEADLKKMWIQKQIDNFRLEYNKQKNMMENIIKDKINQQRLNIVQNTQKQQKDQSKDNQNLKNTKNEQNDNQIIQNQDKNQEQSVFSGFGLETLETQRPLEAYVQEKQVNKQQELQEYQDYIDYHRSIRNFNKQQIQLKLAENDFRNLKAPRKKNSPKFAQEFYNKPDLDKYQVKIENLQELSKSFNKSNSNGNTPKTNNILQSPTNKQHIDYIKNKQQENSLFFDELEEKISKDADKAKKQLSGVFHDSSALLILQNIDNQENGEILKSMGYKQLIEQRVNNVEQKFLKLKNPNIDKYKTDFFDIIMEIETIKNKTRNVQRDFIQQQLDEKMEQMKKYAFNSNQKQNNMVDEYVKTNFQDIKMQMNEKMRIKENLKYVIKKQKNKQKQIKNNQELTNYDNSFGLYSQDNTSRPITRQTYFNLDVDINGSSTNNSNRKSQNNIRLRKNSFLNKNSYSNIKQNQSQNNLDFNQRYIGNQINNSVENMRSSTSQSNRKKLQDFTLNKNNKNQNKGNIRNSLKNLQNQIFNNNKNNNDNNIDNDTCINNVNKQSLQEKNNYMNIETQQLKSQFSQNNKNNNSQNITQNLNNTSYNKDQQLKNNQENPYQLQLQSYQNSSSKNQKCDKKNSIHSSYTPLTPKDNNIKIPCLTPDNKNNINNKKSDQIINKNKNKNIDINQIEQQEQEQKLQQLENSKNQYEFNLQNIQKDILNSAKLSQKRNSFLISNTNSSKAKDKDKNSLINQQIFFPQQDKDKEKQKEIINNQIQQQFLKQKKQIQLKKLQSNNKNLQRNNSNQTLGTIPNESSNNITVINNNYPQMRFQQQEQNLNTSIEDLNLSNELNQNQNKIQKSQSVRIKGLVNSNSVKSISTNFSQQQTGTQVKQFSTHQSQLFQKGNTAILSPKNILYDEQQYENFKQYACTDRENYNKNQQCSQHIQKYLKLLQKFNNNNENYTPQSKEEFNRSSINKKNLNFGQLYQNQIQDNQNQNSNLNERAKTTQSQTKGFQSYNNINNSNNSNNNNRYNKQNAYYNQNNLFSFQGGSKTSFNQTQRTCTTTFQEFSLDQEQLTVNQQNSLDNIPVTSRTSSAQKNNRKFVKTKHNLFRQKPNKLYLLKSKQLYD